VARAWNVYCGHELLDESPLELFGHLHSGSEWLAYRRDNRNGTSWGSTTMTMRLCCTVQWPVYSHTAAHWSCLMASTWASVTAPVPFHSCDRIRVSAAGITMVVQSASREARCANGPTGNSRIEWLSAGGCTIPVKFLVLVKKLEHSRALLDDSNLGQDLSHISMRAPQTNHPLRTVRVV
jgi:hypothetical protein